MQGCLLDHFDKAWTRHSSKLNFLFRQYERHRDEYKEANLNRDVKICQDVDVIAMTITGASINNELLKKLRPNTVIVEEAAEIMEPMLLGCLGDWTERLFLIGDHKQLRPTVENYELVKHCHLDVSMMERLINCGFPFDCLQFQNRMRPDISKYLKLDVYPDLQDNIDSVKGHDIPSFMPKAVAFWDVENMSESGERSYVNNGEAELIVEVAMTFLRFGYKPSQLTILTPYQGQVRLIRQKLRPRLEDWERDVSNRSAALADEANEGFIKVHSIDVYQGDENDIVLVSLVRSEKPGFLASLNRRCVAQSRSRCGLIFIGKASLLRKCAEWSQLLTAFDEDGVLRSDFQVVCRKHGTEHSWRSAAELSRMKGVFCRSKCVETMTCGEHVCPKLCQPWHEHDRCDKMVIVKLPCSHTTKIQCFLSSDPRHLKCEEKCIRMLSCGHPCPLKCSEICDSKHCTQNIEAQLSCGHVQSKLCNQPFGTCQESVAKTLPCGHVKQMLCFEWKKVIRNTKIIQSNTKNTKYKIVKCTETCSKKLPCGHQCTQKCFETCSPQLCIVNVSKRCLACKEQFGSPCGKNQTHCDRIRTVKLSCGHALRTPCSQSSTASLAACKRPCEKTLPCGHKCQSVCSTSPCPPCPEKAFRKLCRHECQCWELSEECLTDVTKKFQCGHEETVACCALARLLEGQSCSACWGLEKQMRLRQLQSAHGSEIKRKMLTETDENTAVEYFKVHDRVMRYIKSEHSVTVRAILSIEKIENPALDRRLLDVSSQLVKKDAVPELFFHGTRNAIAELIIKEGFKVGSSGMYGAGIYFATDTTKSIQYCRESGTMSLLLCDVLLGRTMVCDKPQNHLNLSAVNGADYDSVFARRNTKGTGGVLNDEYIVYRPEQAAPRYLIRFQ
ncbi:hypothetical protein BOX15_Mlig029304g1 [Macrostomum lignano]|uniref:Poly [ADP-ribose] polymerase n=1 Tax=Macrostomum lignano TaxID=282301 RepID=A0A267G0K1_9PLAT|nr:hypothetical protein BOX15_Mlig029304g1 [Macrostomum lignano]